MLEYRHVIQAFILWRMVIFLSEVFQYYSGLVFGFALEADLQFVHCLHYLFLKRSRLNFLKIRTLLNASLLP